MSNEEFNEARIAEMVKASFDKLQQLYADEEAARRADAEASTTPTLERLQARELLTQEALLHGVCPQSVRHVVRDAESVFELREGALVPRDNATDPNDPLAPLTPARWLETLRESEANLFGEDGQPQ